jgi:hypothetical protein
MVLVGERASRNRFGDHAQKATDQSHPDRDGDGLCLLEGRTETFSFRCGARRQCVDDLQQQQQQQQQRRRHQPGQLPHPNAYAGPFGFVILVIVVHPVDRARLSFVNRVHARNSAQRVRSATCPNYLLPGRSTATRCQARGVRAVAYAGGVRSVHDGELNSYL